jgi:taurine dioxygenase
MHAAVEAGYGIKEAAMKVTPLSSHLGAEVEGLDLERVNDDSFAAVNQLVLEHQLVVFRKQALSPEGQIQLSRRFGPLDTHPLTQFNHPQYPEIFVLSNEVQDGKPVGITDGGSYWHSDFAFRERPAKVTMLNAQKIPSKGGATLFINMYTAYDELDEQTKADVEGRRAVHRYRKKANPNAETTKVVMTAEQLAATPDVTHPIVRTHPETGRKALFAHPGITTNVADMDDESSAALLNRVFDHCTQEKYQYAYQWSPGDVVMWDNRCLMHKATTGVIPVSEPRTIFRTTIMGDKPF